VYKIIWLKVYKDVELHLEEHEYLSEIKLRSFKKRSK
jgi:hypothetical protein